MNDPVRWLADFLSDLYCRRGDSGPSAKSRMDREADRIQLGCMLVCLALAIVLTWWIR